MANDVLVLGLGNRLLKDDGIGLHVLAAFGRTGAPRAGAATVRLCDGGTLGLSLLPEIGGANALIVVDAARFDGAPGEVRVFDGDAMDAQVGGARSSAHELALADLLGAALLTCALPERRALVGIAPADVTWGLEPTPETAAGVPAACAAIEAILERWAA